MTNRAVVGECIVVTRCATGGGTVVKPHTRARTLKTRAAHPRQRPREAASCRGIACTAGSSGDDDQGILGVYAGAAAARCPDSGVGDMSGDGRPTIVRVRGGGCALGLGASWSLTFDAHGGTGFRDEVVLDSSENRARAQAIASSTAPPAPQPPPLWLQSGHDPSTAITWETELGSGTCRRTTMDGEHRSLLVSWVRTGQWLNGSKARRRLHLKLLRRSVPLAALIAEHTLVPSTTTTLQQAEPESGEGRGWRERRGRGVRNKKDASRRKVSAPELQRAGPPPDVPAGAGVLLAMAVRGGLTGARLWLEEATLLPHRLELATPEGVDVWVFGRWTQTSAATGGLVLPGTSHHTHAAGNSCRYDMSTAEVVDGGEELEARDSQFAQPHQGYPPSSAHQWLPPVYGTSDCETEVVAARGEGGHVFLLPSLGGTSRTGLSPGWFVLDTSCAGFAVDPAAADAFGMSAFGEVSVVGVGEAALSGRMRRGTHITLGTCTFPAPLYMEQALSAALRTPPLVSGVRGLVSGDGGEGLAGVLGTDYLQHCVVELHAPKRIPGSPNPPVFSASVHDPARYLPTDRCVAAWQPVEWIAGVPHIRVKVTVADDGAASPPVHGEGDRGGGAWSGHLFRLSLGTGGTSVIIASRTAAEWDMVSRTVGLQPGGIMSGPGEERSRLARVDPEVVTGRLSKLDFRGSSFAAVRALTHTYGDPPDLALSPHADGVLCADLFRGCTVVLDLGRDRVAVIRGDQEVD